MLQMNVMSRQSGKTTQAIRKLTEDSEYILIVVAQSHKTFYPMEMRDRIFTVDEFLKGEKLRGRDIVRYHKAVIDEGLLMRGAMIARLYYTFGKDGWDVICYATDKETPDSPPERSRPFSFDDLWRRQSASETSSGHFDPEA